MPFLSDDDTPLDELRLAQRPIDGARFELRAPVVYLDPVSGRRYRAPAHGEQPEPHGVTDLASVPPSLWSFIASYGRQSAPAVVHDARSLAAADLAAADLAAQPDGRRAALEQRREDDLVFRRGLREQRVPVLRAWLMWAWVSADRERSYGGAAGVLLVAQAVLGALVAVAAVVLVFWPQAVAHPAWLALLALPALAALPWRGRAGLVALLSYSLAIVGPLLLVHLLALAVFRLIEAIVELFAGGDPREVLRPTVLSPTARPRRDR